MEHTIEDLLTLMKVMSDKDVTIAELRAQLKMQEEKNTMLESRNEALEERCRKLEEQVQTLQTNYSWLTGAALAMSAENVDLRQQMQTMQRFILLSVPKVNGYFEKIVDMTVQAHVRTFVLDTLPDRAPAEYRSFVQDVTRQRLPPPPEEAKTIHVQGNYNEVHDNGNVECH